MEQLKSVKVYDLVKKIPKGRVTTYGEIAKALGNIRYARAVGKILNKNLSKDVPCHRVVYSNGKIGGFRYGIKRKISLLRSEGIAINEGKILNFEKVLFRFRN
ncbi:MAG: MGMT family protein [Candidatus Altiarchaeota archaeon]